MVMVLSVATACVLCSVAVFYVQKLRLYVKHLEKSLNEIESKKLSLEEENNELKMQNVRYETILKTEIDKNRDLDIMIRKIQEELLSKFKNISSDITSSNNKVFLEMAKESLEKYQNAAKHEFEIKEQSIKNIVTPISESLKIFNDRINVIEKDRASTYESLREQVQNLLSAQKELKRETTNLVGALKSPNIRGKWGEVQLKRLLEISGMIPYCDFEEQKIFNEDQKILRPDVIINLPDERKVIIDAKTPVLDYIEAISTNDTEAQNSLLKTYIKSINEHIAKLSSKKYQDAISSSLEFVIMFLPGESFFAAALQNDPTIIEKAMKQKVIIATPTTLLAMLNTIAITWKQYNITNNLKEVLNSGEKLCKQVQDLSEILQKIGKNLKTSVSLYDDSVLKLESKIFKNADNFSKLISQNNDQITLLK